MECNLNLSSWSGVRAVLHFCSFNVLKRDECIDHTKKFRRDLRFSTKKQVTDDLACISRHFQPCSPQPQPFQPYEIFTSDGLDDSKPQCAHYISMIYLLSTI